MTELLYRSFDNALTSGEQKQLERALKQSKELREEKRQINTMRTAISDSPAKSFKPFFTDKVMQRISSFNNAKTTPDTFFESLFTIFRPVFVTATILLIALLSYNLIKSDQPSLAGAFAEPEVTLEQAIDPTFLLTME